MSVLARVVVKSGLRGVGRDVGRSDDGVVVLFEGTLAVPVVAWVVMLPERIINGEVEPRDPIASVSGFGFGGCCGHPSEVGHDVSVGLVDLPVGCVVCAYDGGVVLGL